MVIALIFAGGTGQRMSSRTRPKQFLELHGKSVLIHTIERFERHMDVDAIAVVCLERWIDELKLELERFFIKKVSCVVAGGATGQESIYRGLCAIKSVIGAPDDAIVLIHDGVRPLIDDQLISDNIASVIENGSAISCAPVFDTVAVVDEAGTIASIPERSALRSAKAPQSFYLKDILESHEIARRDGITTFVNSAELMMNYGHKLYSVPCSGNNIKITTATDYYIFRALYEALENQQILGV